MTDETHSRDFSKKHRKYDRDLHTDEQLKEPNVKIYDATDDAC